MNVLTLYDKNVTVIESLPTITAVLNVDFHSLLLEQQDTIRDRVEVTVENGDWKGNRVAGFWVCLIGEIGVICMLQTDINQERTEFVKLDAITLNINLTVPYSSRKDLAWQFTVDLNAFREATRNTLPTYGDLWDFIVKHLGGFDKRP